MSALASSKDVHVRSCYGVYLCKERCQFGGIEVLPLTGFLERLFEGEVF